MPDALKCTSCRTPIDVPPGHDGDTIRCGICWTEVPVPKAVVIRPAAAVPAAKPKPAAAVKESGIRVAALLPTGATPAAGMARLEALLHKAGARLHPAPAPVKAAPIVPLVSTAPAAVEIIEPEIVAEVVPTVTPALPAPLPSAVPVLQPSAAARAKAGRKIEDDEPARKRNKFKARGDRDDEDDDRPRKRATRGGALVFALSAAGVLVVVLVVCGVLIFRSLMDDTSDESADNKPGAGNNFNPQANPNPLPQFRVRDPDPVPPAPLPNDPPPAGPNDQPGFAPVPGVIPPRPNPRPRPVRPPAAEVEWRPLAGDGFAAEMPADAPAQPHWLHVHGAGAAARAGFVKADGQKYTARAAGHTFEVSYVDLPAQFEPKLEQVLTPFADKQARVRPCRLAGRDGFEFAEEFIGTTVRRLIQVGRRVYVFHAQTAAGGDPQASEALRKKFFDSVKITVDGGAAADPGAKPDDPPAAGDQQNVPPAGKALTAHARVDPFWAAAVLPDRNEVLLIGTRMNAAGRAAGVLRRFTYPGFVPKNTYYLPLPVTYTVADEKAGKLAVATVTRTDPLLKEAERNIAHGDVQVYDLKPLFDGTVGERDELKPAATIPFSARLAGLEFAGGKGYVLSLTNQQQNRAKPWKPKLTQIDVSAGKAVQEMELPDPACRIKASADGKRVYCAEAALSPIGAPLFELSRSGYVLVVDVPGWKRERTVTVPGTACDLAVTEDGTVVASVAANRTFKLYAIPGTGNTVDLNPAAGPPATLGYAALTADGRKLVTAASPSAGATGVGVYEVSNLDGASGLKRVADGRSVKLPGAASDAAVPLGGHFHLTPDGRFALFQVGVVLDLTKLPAN